MIAAYVRVSSKSQDYSTQQSSIARAAAARGDTIDRWFEEKRSGRTTDRPVLREVRELARRGEINTLYAFRLDRLTRSGIRDTLALLEELKQNGCQLKTIADGFSLEGPGADVVVSVLAWAASLERLKIDENLQAARERIESQGGKWGRPLKLDDATLARMLKRRNRGDTIREIAVALKIPHSTVSEALSGKGSYATALQRVRNLSESHEPKKGKRGVSG